MLVATATTPSRWMIGMRPCGPTLVRLPATADKPGFGLRPADTQNIGTVTELPIVMADHSE